MKIALLGPAPPFRGGISQFANHLAKELLAQDNELCFFNFKSQYPKLLFPAGSQEDDSKPVAESKRLLTPYLPWTYFRTIKELNRFEPDILIVSWWLPFFAPAFGYILRKVRAGKKVLLAHNIIPHERWPFSFALCRYVLGKADSILLLSRSSLQELKRYYPNNYATKAVLGFHPLYEARGEYKAKELKQPTLLFFGMIKPYKGLDILLRALAVVKESLPEVKLIVAGSVYKDRELYESLIDELGLSDSVETQFRYVSDEEVRELFHRSAVAVLPYRTATQSGVIATAYSYLTPVICSDVGGLGEYVKEGKTGLLVEPDSIDGLAQAILYFFDKQLLKGMQEEIVKLKDEQSWAELATLIIDR